MPEVGRCFGTMPRVIGLLAVAIAIMSCTQSVALSQEEMGELAAYSAPGETRELEDWVRRGTGDRAQLLGLLCDAHARVGRYRAAADACRARAASSEAPDAGLVRSIAFWTALADQPPISVIGSIDAPLTYGWTGMAEVEVEVAGTRSRWGVDTGAEVTVLSVTNARAFGVRMLQGEVGVVGSTPGVVAGGLGMIVQLRIGDALISDVPVLVLPDEALSHEGRSVPPILGMPIFYAFGSIEFADHGRRMRTLAAAGLQQGERMRWTEAGVAIRVALSHGAVWAHLDTGANRSEFVYHARSLLARDELARLIGRSTITVGVSGQVEGEAFEASMIQTRVADARCDFGPVLFGGDAVGEEGRVGIDLVKACATFTLDFRSMRVRAG